MRPREYPLLCEAVEVGVAHGWRRAFKHREDPLPEAEAAQVREAIAEAVLSDILERFALEDAPEEE